MPQVPGDLDKYARQVAAATGLDPRVIEAWWIAENGWKIPSSNNFGNIEKTNVSYLNQGVVGTFKNGRFAVYDSPESGAAAFGNLINKGSYYSGIRASAGKSPLDQIKAIATSPWDEGHYGGDGRNLIAVYNSITGVSPLPAGGGSSGSAPVESPGAIQTGFPSVSDLQNTMIKAFWLIFGAGLVFVGVYLLLNPLGNLTDVLSKINLGGKADA